MKKFITSAYSRLGRFVVIAVAGCIFSACSDFLDVPLESTVATSNFYKTAEEFDMGLTGVYNMLLSAEWANGDRYGSYFQGFLILGRVGTDEMIIRPTLTETRQNSATTPTPLRTATSPEPGMSSIAGYNAPALS